MEEHHHEHSHEHGHGHGGHGHHGHHGGHGHHEHGYSTESLSNNDALYRDVYAQIVAWLSPRQDAAIIEAGSGAGGFTCLLAQAAPKGKVTALDESEEMLTATRGAVDAAGLGDRVIYQQGDITHIPLPDEAFDLAWSSRTIHHLPDQLAGVRELARVLKPGGRLALREGAMHAQFLPDDIGIGEPGLEARLDVAYYRWFFANVRGEGKRYPFGWTQMLRDAGLAGVTAKTFLLEALPPFTDVQIRYMSRHLKRWLEDDDRRAALAPNDVRALELLTDSSSEHFVFGRDDLYLREAVTVFTGVRPQ